MPNESDRVMRTGHVTVSGPGLGEAALRPAPVRATRGGGPTAPDGLLDAIDRHFTTLDAVELDVDIPAATRGSEQAAPAQVEVDVDPDRHPVLLVQDDATGVWSWVFPDAPAGGTRGATAPGTTFAVPLDATPAPTERGLTGAIAKKVIRVLVDTVGGELLGRAGEALAERWERDRRPAGVRWFSPSDYRAPLLAGRFDATDAARLASGRSLLFLHGTMSLSHNGFARIPPATMQALGAAYAGRVWAYDHPTLATSPADNAAWLVEELSRLRSEAPWDVDIVAHSRGGLVARELVERLRGHSPLRVRNVVFFATPNSGTPLCSAQHLDRFVNRYTNLLTLVPDNAITDTIDSLVALVKQVLLRMYDGIPGVQAMDPDGSYLRGLNALDPPDEAVYHAIASDFDPPPSAGIAGRLRNVAFDKAFGDEPNDLIVPAASASRAGNRVLVPPERCHVFGKADGIDHSGYWDARPVVDRMSDIATGQVHWAVPFPAPAPPALAVRDIGLVAGSAVAPGPSTDDGGVPKLEVSVVHGSLEYASYPVMVGHCKGATLQGAELFVDGRLDGLLASRQMIGRYPERPGEAIFLRPRSRDDDPDAPPRFPPGAYVLGLGDPGELTRNKVVMSVRAALVERGIELYERVNTPGTLIEFGVSSVLVGAFPIDGITVETSIVAIVEGVLAANAAFRRFEEEKSAGGRQNPRVRVTALEVIERYADRAELAAHAVRSLGRLLDRVANVDNVADTSGVRIESRPGGLPYRPPLREAETAWRRVLVTVSDRERERLAAHPGETPASLELELTVLGRLARADRLRHAVDGRTVDHLVAAAISDRSPDPQVTNTLWELLLPVELKDDLIGAGRIQLIVDEWTANYPWELMSARETNMRWDARLDLARAGLLRQFRESSGGQRLEVRRALGNCVLVVGDPPLDPKDYPWLSGTYQPLPGATEEARAVREAFSRPAGEGFEVVPLIWSDRTYEPAGDQSLDAEAKANSGRGILNALYRRDYRIVHVAAHGTVADDPAESGALIGGGMYLTANVIRQLPAVPDLVFLNCCHLARVGFNRLAAGIARELLGIGVQVVVAAGWAVDDGPARDFATAFYGSLLAGREFGDAVSDARKATQKAARSLTWGAYQCYGDPGFRLRLGGGGTIGGKLNPVSRDELLREVRTLGVRVSDVGRTDAGARDQRRRELIDDLADLRTSAPPEWLDPEVEHAFGRAFADLGDLDRAVGAYRSALNGGPAYPAVLIQQLANREVRLAQQRASGRAHAATIDETPEQLVAAARTHLEMAKGLGPPDADRSAIEGSLCKKEATLLEAGPRRAELIAAASRAYREAHELERAGVPGGDGSAAPGAAPRAGVPRRDAYPACNWLQMESLVAGWPVPDNRLVEALDEVLTWLGPPEPPDERRHDKRVAPDFWTLAQAGDVGLTRLLATPGGGTVPPETIGGIIEAYERAFRTTRSSWGSRNSVLENLRDLRTLAEGTDALVAAISSIIEALEAWEQAHDPDPLS